MKYEYNWGIFLSYIILAGISQVDVTDIGYRCHSDAECRAGNGGQFSRCYNYPSVCVCTHDPSGNETRIELNEEDLKCNHTNECNKENGCYIKCLPKDLDNKMFHRNDVGCETVIFCNNKECSVGCAPRALLRRDTNKDWYWTIPKLFVADFVLDTNTSVCYDPDRAVNSRPEGFVIKKSGIPGAGLGVFTEEYIPRGTVIGPYKGIRVYDDTYNASMSWKIVTADSLWRVDARDESLSNWVRYINHPNTADSENLLAIHHEGEMFYLAFKSIQPGSELFVWYGNEYAVSLGIKTPRRPNYAYGKDGYIGGKCLQRALKYVYGNLYTMNCFIDNAVCMRVICLCKSGSHARGGDCINDETVGGRCIGKNGDVCKNDENAECWNGVCFCNKNSTQLNKKCIKDETYGGSCMSLNKDCALDRNAECVHHICECKFGTSEVSGKCVSDETAGGLCKGIEGQNCLEDTNAVCINGTCVCKKGAHLMGQNCRKNDENEHDLLTGCG